jgi:hypothetical protein
MEDEYCSNKETTENNRNLKPGALVKLTVGWQIHDVFKTLSIDNQKRDKNEIIRDWVLRNLGSNKHYEIKGVPIYAKEIVSLSGAGGLSELNDKLFVVLEGPLVVFQTAYVSLNTHILYAHILYAVDPKKYPLANIEYYKILLNQTTLWFRKDSLIEEK